MSLTLVKTVCLSTALLAAGPAFAETTPTLQNWAEKARMEFAAKQRYPRRALEAGAEGTVKVRVRVSRDGAVGGFEIIERSGNAVLDAEAIDLIARVDPLPSLPGVSEDYSFVVPLQFRLADGSASATAVKVEKASEDMTGWRQKVERQVARRQAYPQYLLNRGVEGAVKLRLDVASDGTVLDSTVLRSSGNADLDEEALLLAGDLDLPGLPAGMEGFSLVLPLKYEIAEERHSFARR